MEVVSLTPRELSVLRGMADGRKNAEIGRELFISEDTVKTHARRLFKKLGARDRAHAAAIGFQKGLLEGPDVVVPAVPVAAPVDPVLALRIARATKALAEWRQVRDDAPDDSRFARFFDDLAAKLARPKPPPP